MAEWTCQLDAAVDRLVPEMVEIRRHLHAHPEPSGFEHETSLYLYQRLDAAGFDVRLGNEGRGVIVDRPADATAPRTQPTVALRADIDALRIEDAKTVGYKSQVAGVMHACGHDAHAATLVGALCALAEIAAAGDLPWPVRWRGILQPAEETSRGALEMIAGGALEGVDAIFGLHMDPSRDVGRIGLRAGAFTAACDEMTIRLAGRGGHAARPHESRDPIAAAAQLISSIYLFMPRAIDSQESVVATIGQVTGGDNPNVIPEQVVLRGTLRSLSPQVREHAKVLIRQLTHGLSETTRTKIEVEFAPGPPSVHNDRVLSQLVRQSAAEVVGAEHVDKLSRPSMGGEDFAFYLEHVPGVMFRLGCRSPSIGGESLHSPLFDIDERAMAYGAKILARTAVEWAKARHP